MFCGPEICRCSPRQSPGKHGRQRTTKHTAFPRLSSISVVIYQLLKKNKKQLLNNVFFYYLNLCFVTFEITPNYN